MLGGIVARERRQLQQDITHTLADQRAAEHEAEEARQAALRGAALVEMAEATLALAERKRELCIERIRKLQDHLADLLPGQRKPVD